MKEQKRGQVWKLNTDLFSCSGKQCWVVPKISWKGASIWFNLHLKISTYVEKQVSYFTDDWKRPHGESWFCVFGSAEELTVLEGFVSSSSCTKQKTFKWNFMENFESWVCPQMFACLPLIFLSSVSPNSWQKPSAEIHELLKRQNTNAKRVSILETWSLIKWSFQIGF